MRPPPAKAWQVYSWWQDAWWQVDQADTLDAATASAARRRAFVALPFTVPALVRRHGRITLNDAGRFIVLPKGQRP